MKADRSLHLTAYATAVAAVFMLGQAERDPLLGVLAIIVCGIGVFIKEAYDKHLNTFWGNLAALGALVFALWSFHPERPELRLIAMANLLVYAQFVLFYRERIPQTYWMILLLSLLQVCVASVLINDFYFGLMLIGYMLLATRMIIQLTYRRECFDATKDKRFKVSLFSRRRRRAASGTGPVTAVRPESNGLRWSLSRQPATFKARVSRKSDGAEYRGFERHWLWLCALTVISVPLVFAIMPRPYAEGGLSSGDVGALNSTGFNSEVTLGELGMILESTEEVMRVTLKTGVTGAHIQLPADEQPLFTGVAFGPYKDGKWELAGGRQGTAEDLKNLPPATDDYVIQEVEILPDNHKFLFGIYPVYRANMEGSDKVRWDTGREALVRNGDLSRQIKYVTLSTGIKNGRMLDKIDVMTYPDPDRLQDFPDNLGQLQQVAAQVIASLPADEQANVPANYEVQARALEAFLRDSGQFQYSLQAPARDPNMDPIEDFLVNNPQGHCEYFASALTLMLRSQKIPARMVNGYKGGDWNSLGRFYQVRQLHAHVWVEVLLTETDQLDYRRRPKQQWLILDPTPAASVEITMWSNIQQFTDYVQHMWSSYVLGMSSDSSTKDFYSELLSPSAWRAWIDDMKGFISGEGTLTGFLNLRFIVTILVLPLFLYGLFRLLRYAFGRLSKKDSRRSKKRLAAEAQVEFYRRFESILAQRRIRRDAAQTQREFAMAVGGHFSGEDATRSLAAIPRYVVDAFYRVRFGKHQLQLDELNKLSGELDRLEAQVPRAAASEATNGANRHVAGNAAENATDDAGSNGQG